MQNNPLHPPLMQVLRAIVAAKPAIIDAMGISAIDFIDENFAKQGFQGAAFQPWPKRLKKDKGRQRAILVDTATLRRSFKQTNATNHTTISTDVVYAQAHNEGLVINKPSRSVILNYSTKKGGKLRLSKVRTENQQRQIKQIRRATIGSHTVKMKERKFIGESPVLSSMCQEAALKILNSKIPD